MKQKFLYNEIDSALKILLSIRLESNLVLLVIYTHLVEQSQRFQSRFVKKLKSLSKQRWCRKWNELGLLEAPKRLLVDLYNMLIPQLVPICLWCHILATYQRKILSYYLLDFCEAFDWAGKHLTQMLFIE